MEDVRAIQGHVRQLQAARNPLIQPWDGSNKSRQPRLPPGFLLGREQTAQESEFDLPLWLGPIGAVDSHQVFDDRISTSQEFGFKSLKECASRKSRIDNYMIKAEIHALTGFCNGPSVKIVMSPLRSYGMPLATA